MFNLVQYKLALALYRNFPDYFTRVIVKELIFTVREINGLKNFAEAQSFYWFQQFLDV